MVPLHTGQIIFDSFSSFAIAILFTLGVMAREVLWFLIATLHSRQHT